MPRRSHPRLSSASRRLLARIAEGNQVDRTSAEISGLVAAGLAVVGADGRVTVTDAGRAHLARATSARAARAGPARREAGVDPFIEQHAALAPAEIEDETGPRSVLLNLAESPLLWLARHAGRDGRPLIAPEQFAAGERLRADFTRARMMPRTTANWSAAVAHGRRGSGHGTAVFTDATLAARQRVQRAIDAVGPELAGLLLDVCCFLKRLDDVERERRWPPRSAKIVLQVGLDQLARHYGYGPLARGKARAAIRAWQDEVPAAAD